MNTPYLMSKGSEKVVLSMMTSGRPAREVASQPADVAKEFKALMLKHDPEGKFRNNFIDTTLFG